MGKVERNHGLELDWDSYRVVQGSGSLQWVLILQSHSVQKLNAAGMSSAGSGGCNVLAVRSRELMVTGQRKHHQQRHMINRSNQREF